MIRRQHISIVLYLFGFYFLFYHYSFSIRYLFHLRQLNEGEGNSDSGNYSVSGQTSSLTFYCSNRIDMKIFELILWQSFQV